MTRSQKSRLNLGSYPPIALSALTLIVNAELIAYTFSVGIPTNPSGIFLISAQQCFACVNGDTTRPSSDIRGAIAATSSRGATNIAALQRLHRKSIGRLVS